MGRQSEIKDLERLRGNRVLAYVTSDRVPVGANIAGDAVRPFFDVLRDMGKVETLDLFVYSRGGSPEVPWRIASALRTYADSWNILVPFRANSAATLLALGADKIVLGRHGELGPIDPTINIQRTPGSPGQPSTPTQDSISVEDVMAYLNFVKDEVGLTDQSNRAESLGHLANRIDAVILGSVYRTRSHIRDVAHRMLTSQQNPPGERIMETIVETLAERVYAHDHAVGLKEAADIGLPVEAASDEVEAAMWNLLSRYEEELEMRNPIDPMEMVQNTDRIVEELEIAAIESKTALFEFRGKLDVQAMRQMPPTLNVSLNLNLPLPSSIDTDQLPAELQQIIEQFQRQMAEQLLPHADQAVKEALKAQAPLTNVAVNYRGGKWVQMKPASAPAG